MAFLLQLHGDLRWLVALVAVVTVVKYAAGWLGKMEYKRLDRILFSATTGLFDLNLVLGLVLLIFLGGGLPANRLEHAVTMILAVAVMHSSVMWRKTGSDLGKFRNGALTLVLALVLVFVGVTRLRGGWMF